MRLIDIVNGKWAITPEMHSEVQSIYARHMRGDKINLGDIEAAIGKPLGGATSGYDVVNGVAVLPLEGVLAKRMNLFMQISGGTSMQMAANSFRDAIANPDVTAIILAIDSPGGTVDGTQELSDLIYSSRGEKPVIALASGVMASAAYWIGSAASQVFMSSETDIVGSIGVVQAHVDVSRAEDMQGRKTTEVTAGQFKRIASQYAPLSQDGRATLQDQVDQVYGVFVSDVARNRGVSEETVLEDMADGRVFIGQQAINAGLVDGVSTLDALIARASAGEFSLSEDDAGQVAHAAAGAPQADVVQTPTPKQAASAGDAPKATQQEKTMDVQTLKAEHPDVAEALINEGREAGATAERERIQAVEAQSMPGHEKLIATLKFDGKTSGPEAAVQVLAAEKQKKGDRLADLRADANDSRVRHAAAPEPGDEDDEDEEDDDQSADEDMDGKKGKKASIANMADARAVAAAAQEYQREMAGKGKKVSTAEAVAYVTQKKEARRHG
jgi:signal peptide peptidase SppA